MIPLRLLPFFLGFLLMTLTPALAQNDDADFARVAEEFISGYLKARPLEAVALGYHEYDGKIADYTALGVEAELHRLGRFDDRLQKFELGKLTPRNGIDLRILQSAISRELFRIEDMRVYEMNPMTYAGAIDVNIYIARNFGPLEDRVRNIVSILAQAPNVMIAARTNLAQELPRPHVELAIQIARGSADFLRKDLVSAVAEIKDDKLRTLFAETNRKAAMALTDYAAWLEKQKLPKATASYALGEEKYRRLLAETEFVDLPPARVLEIGLRELKKEQDAFAEAARKIDPTLPPQDVARLIQKEHPTAAGLIPDTANNLEAIRKFVVENKLVTIPSEVRVKVKETPQYQRATSTASMDTPGPFERKAKEAYYYVTPVEPDWPENQQEEWLSQFNYYTTDVVSIHEAYPGHYTQFLRLNASSANRLEKIFGSYAFIEGWAHYTEKMMLDEGFGRSPAADGAPGQDEARAAKYRMAQAMEALLRLCRLCVSVKMHTENMTVDEATRFFMENSYYEEKPARAEAMRGTYDPGYLNYTLGKLQILKLRDDYKAQEGDKFSLQKFHDTMLDQGMPPIRLLREIMLKDEAKWPEVL